MKALQPSCKFDRVYGKGVEAKEIICGTPFPALLLPLIWREIKFLKRGNVKACRDMSKEFILGLFIQNLNIKP